MKKFYVVFCLCLFMSCSAHAMTKQEAIKVCTELSAKEMQDSDLRTQKLAEDACLCIADNMPRSTTAKQFKRLVQSNDESIKNIAQTCTMEVLFTMPEMQLLLLQGAME